MLGYAIRRLLLAALITVVAVTILFIIIHSVPGDPASVMLGPRATPELKAALAEKMGLNEPLTTQIVIFFGNLLRGDLGTDVFSNRAVTDIVFGQVRYNVEVQSNAVLVSDDVNNSRLDGSSTDIARLLSNDDHSGVHEPNTESMNFVLDRLVTALFGP